MKWFVMLPFFASKKLASIAHDSVHADITLVKRLNQGFYGYVYLLKDRKDRRFVAKVFKNIGYMAREEAQLNMLRKYALVHVPEIIGKSGKMQNGAFDVLFMEYIHGVNASRLHLLSASDKARFADEVVDNLLAIHSVSSPQGFGDFVDGRYFETWAECYRGRINTLYTALQQKKPLLLSASSRKLIDTLYASFDRVFAQPVLKNALIHGDYNLWNLMADPVTGRLTGMLDPMGCCFADRELELFQLENANAGEYALLENYAGKVQLSDRFLLKKNYYRFWDDVYHLVHANYCDNKLFQRYGGRVLELLD